MKSFLLFESTAHPVNPTGKEHLFSNCTVREAMKRLLPEIQKTYPEAFIACCGQMIRTHKERKQGYMWTAYYLEI